MNNNGRNRGRNKVVLFLDSYWTADLAGLRCAAIVAHALGRALIALIMAGVYWLLLLLLSALGWVMG